MANTKIYTVVKDGEELDKVKTLAAAKKLADAEGAEVYSEGKCVYRATVEETVTPISGVQDEADDMDAVVDADNTDGADEANVSDTSETTAEEAVRKTATESYRLKSLMNVREKPKGAIIGTLPENTVVEVISIENDWLHLKNGTFILYGGGEFAVKIG